MGQRGGGGGGGTGGGVTAISFQLKKNNPKNNHTNINKQDVI